MGISVLDQHKAIIKQRSRDAYSTHVDMWRKQVITAWTVAGITSLVALGAIGIAFRTASSVVVQHEVRTVDRLGQTIGVTGAVYRVPSGVQTHAFINDFIVDVFSVVGSPLAMQRNYEQAQSYVDEHGPVSGYLRDFWAGYSPLGASGTWNHGREQERVVQVTSLLDRGKFANGGGEEYELEWTVQPDAGGGHLGAPKLYKGDLVLESGGTPNDANPWGLLVTHFSWNDLR